MPLRFVMDAVMKVTFPAYARMQADKEELKKAVEKTLFFLSLIIFPLLVGITVLAQPLVHLIPKYSKWEVALLALYLFIVNSFWAAVTTPLMNALTAVGKIKIVFKLMVMWTVLTWIIYPILAIKYGFNGVALGAALVSFSSAIAIWLTKKYIDFKFFAPLLKPTLGCLAMGFGLLFLRNFLPLNIFSLILLIFIGGLFYGGLVFLMVGKSLTVDVKKLFYAFKNH